MRHLMAVTGAPSSGEALSADSFSSLMQKFLPLSEGGIGLAVSGGPDSMALAFAVARWAKEQLCPLPLVFIVDHGLRSESTLEAATVRERLEKIGLTAEILRWEHAPVLTRLQAEARKARYALLTQACKKHGIATLVFAHQREDQAETILMRLAKGTGLDGFAGIRPQSVQNGVTIIRPLLTVAKETLVATCHEQNIPFVTDPSNALDKFARGRLRRVMPLLAEEGLTIERLLDFGARAAETRDALDHFTQVFLAASSQRDAYGTIAIDKAALLAAPRAIALRALGQALHAIHTSDYAPPHAALSALFDALRADKIMVPHTLHGCLVSDKKRGVTIAREFANIRHRLDVQPGATVAWDRRWLVTLSPGETPATVRALGNPPHDVLDRLAPGLRRKLPQGRIRASLPALWRGEELLHIPVLAKESGSETTSELLGIWPIYGQN